MLALTIAGWQPRRRRSRGPRRRCGSRVGAGSRSCARWTTLKPARRSARRSERDAVTVTCRGRPRRSPRPSSPPPTLRLRSHVLDAVAAAALRRRSAVRASRLRRGRRGARRMMREPRARRGAVKPTVSARPASTTAAPPSSARARHLAEAQPRRSDADDRHEQREGRHGRGRVLAQQPRPDAEADQRREHDDVEQREHAGRRRTRPARRARSAGSGSSSGSGGIRLDHTSRPSGFGEARLARRDVADAPREGGADRQRERAERDARRRGRRR